MLVSMETNNKKISNTMKQFFMKFYKDVSKGIEKIMKPSVLKLDSFSQINEEVNTPQK